MKKEDLLLVLQNPELTKILINVLSSSDDSDDTFKGLAETKVESEKVLGGFKQGDIAKSVNEANFPMIGVTRQFVAHNKHTIRSAMAKAGFGCHIKDLKKNTFAVTRTVKQSRKKSA